MMEKNDVESTDKNLSDQDIDNSASDDARSLSKYLNDSKIKNFNFHTPSPKSKFSRDKSTNSSYDASPKLEQNLDENHQINFNDLKESIKQKEIGENFEEAKKNVSSLYEENYVSNSMKRRKSLSNQREEIQFDSGLARKTSLQKYNLEISDDQTTSKMNSFIEYLKKDNSKNENAINFLRNKDKNLNATCSVKKDDIFESHITDINLMRGYYSDTERSTSKNNKYEKKHSIGIEDFEFLKFLGRGAYGSVYLVKKKKTGDLYAMKIIDFASKNLSYQNFSNLKKEHEIYKKLKGDYVVKAYWSFYYKNYVCFVLEYISGGDLSHLLEDYGCLEEVHAKFYFSSLAVAVQSLHDLDIIHRDLKPNNVMIDANGHLKLTDFGLSEQGVQKKKELALANSAEYEEAFSKSLIINSNEELDTSNSSQPKKKGDKKLFRIIGTPDYMAPEVILGEDSKGKALDWWSMGVILYEILVGIPPFNDDTVEKIFDNITHHKIEWPTLGNDSDCLSNESYDLINKLLDSNPKTRLGSVDGLEELKNHPFFKGIDWEKLQFYTPPYIPEANSYENWKEKIALDHIFTSNKQTLNANIEELPIHDIFDFRMRRVDLLFKKNQDQLKFMNSNE